MMSTAIGLATRTSRLAMAQAGIVAAKLGSIGAQAEIIGIETTGDSDRHSPVTALTEMGAFVRAVQAAVIDGRADVAVHSGKDLPVAGPSDLEAFHLERASASDVLCGVADLAGAARIGTGSPRRRAQLAGLAPGLEIVDLRGNVDTRLARCGRDLDGVVLAEAGLARLGLTDRIGHRFAASEMVPAPAQGAITVEARAGTGSAALLRQIEHQPTRRAVTAERRLLELTGAGCRSALGAFASVNGDGSLTMLGFVEDESGPRYGQVEADDPESSARALKAELGL